MAYQFFRVGEQSGRTFREYNIDHPVGRGATNLTDDVMLVQLLLHIVYFEIDFPDFQRLSGDEELIVNGEANDELTFRYIVHFKTQLIKRGIHLHPDQVMDPMRDNHPGNKSTISKTVYAFSLLMNVCEHLAPARFVTFPENEETPDTLRAALRQTRKT